MNNSWESLLTGNEQVPEKYYKAGRLVHPMGPPPAFGALNGNRGGKPKKLDAVRESASTQIVAQSEIHVQRLRAVLRILRDVYPLALPRSTLVIQSGLSKTMVAQCTRSLHGQHFVEELQRDCSSKNPNGAYRYRATVKPGEPQS
jgi:hypothetical protein